MNMNKYVILLLILFSIKSFCKDNKLDLDSYLKMNRPYPADYNHIDFRQLTDNEQPILTLYDKSLIPDSIWISTKNFLLKRFSNDYLKSLKFIKCVKFKLPEGKGYTSDTCYAIYLAYDVPIWDDKFKGTVFSNGFEGYIYPPIYVLSDNNMIGQRIECYQNVIGNKNRAKILHLKPLLEKISDECRKTPLKLFGAQIIGNGDILEWRIRYKTPCMKNGIYGYFTSINAHTGEIIKKYPLVKPQEVTCSDAEY